MQEITYNLNILTAEIKNLSGEMLIKGLHYYTCSECIPLKRFDNTPGSNYVDEDYVDWLLSTPCGCELDVSLSEASQKEQEKENKLDELLPYKQSVAKNPGNFGKNLWWYN